MNHHLFSTLLLAGLALAATGSAQAEPRAWSRGAAVQGAGGAAAGQRGVVADGQGNAQGATRSGFTTQAGAHGQRTGNFQRSADGSVNANGQASATGRNGGSAERSASLDRNADGSASGRRSTTATNANTGVTFDGQTTYTKGSGVSRTGSCTDASGQSVTCGSAR